MHSTDVGEPKREKKNYCEEEVKKKVRKYGAGSSNDLTKFEISRGRAGQRSKYSKVLQIVPQQCLDYFYLFFYEFVGIAFPFLSFPNNMFLFLSLLVDLLLLQHSVILLAD